MFINTDSLIINNVNMGQYLVQADFEYDKIWSSDTGRDNFAGTMQGTLVGIFPKIVCYYRALTPTEIHLLAPIFDSAWQTVQYYDDNAGATKTMTSYTGDWKVTSKNMYKGEPFQVSFIAKRRRT